MIRANCDVSVELDRPDRRYRQGERVTGKVRVRVDAETKCDRLTLTRQWQTHGKGNRASGPAASQNLFSGVLQPGDYAYPFELPAPQLPLTYRGKILNVDWYLDARADVPWAIDAKGRTDFFVETPAGTQAEVVTVQDTANTALGETIGFVVVGAFMLIGLGTLAVGVAESNLIWLMFGTLWSMMVGVFMWVILKKRLAKSAFSRFEAQIEQVAPNRIAVPVSYKTNKLVNDLTIKLVVQEVVVSGSGTNKTTYSEIMHEDLRRVHVGHVGQHSARVEFELPDPSSVGWSFEASDNSLKWFVSVDCDIDNWPDLVEGINMQVLPRFGPA